MLLVQPSTRNARDGGSNGPIPTVPLWEKLLDELDKLGWTVRSLKAPSHINLSWNIQANSLANIGRLCNSLNPSILKKQSITRNMHPI